MSVSVDVTLPVSGVGLVTIARPEKFNAIDPQTDRAMADALRALDGNPQVRCIVITGAGSKAFCAGADIEELLPLLKRNILANQDSPQFCGVTHWPSTHKPLLAAINGVALGGGLELALSCDLRIASSNASFGLPEITVGVLAGGGGCTRLPRTVPAALAAEMILTGRPINAERALQAGLISEIVTPEALLDRALKLAEIIASRAPQSLRACTELLRRPRFEELQDDAGA
ncbi:enoyl-CoA hydratase/isomerase family protein [Polaromonas sp. P1(28)-13]|nr:enoyl-CoA hydratase/isomerase family protein [Polaromonas sp. P1(28)-13]